MTKAKRKSPFAGQWPIVCMTPWDEDSVNDEVQAFIEFEAKAIGYVRLLVRR
jgi:hypothetical protein